MFRFVLILTILLFTCNSISYTQSKDFHLREFKIPIEKILDYIENGNLIEFDESKDNYIQGTQNENVISAKSIVESEVHAAINPTDKNNIIVSPISQTETVSDLSLYCSIYFTKDMGNSWNESNFRTTPIAHRNNYLAAGGGDPVLAFSKSGRAYLSWIYIYLTRQGTNIDSIYTAMQYAYSDDGGETWTNAKNHIYLAGYKVLIPQFAQIYLESVADKQWITIDSKGNINISYVIIDVDFMNQRQTTNLVFDQANESGDFKNRLSVTKSNYSFSQFVTNTVDSEDNIHFAFVATVNDVPGIYYNNSMNNGVSIGNEKRITNIYMPRSILNQAGSIDTVPGILVQRLYPAPLIVADNSNISPFADNLYIVWNANGINSNNNSGMDIYFIKSTDKGNTWSTPRILFPDQPGQKISQFYPTITVNENGIIAICYYDRSHDSQLNNSTHYMLTLSYDGGETFTDPISVSGTPSNFSSIGLRNNGFGIGEYTQVVMNDEFVFPVWSDGRTNNGNINIYTAKINISNPNSIDKITPINRNTSITSIFPLPIDNEFTVGFTLDDSSKVNFEVISLDGKIIDSINAGNFDSGYNEYKLNSENLGNGFYYLRLTSDYSYSSIKILK